MTFNIPLFLPFACSCLHIQIIILYCTFSLALMQNCCRRRSMCAYPQTCYIKVCHNGQQEAHFLLRPEVLSFISGRQRSQRGAGILLKLAIVEQIGSLLQNCSNAPLRCSKSAVKIRLKWAYPTWLNQTFNTFWNRPNS